MTAITYCAYLGCKAGPQYMVDPKHSKTPVCGRHLAGKVKDLLTYDGVVEVVDYYGHLAARYDGQEAPDGR